MNSTESTESDKGLFLLTVLDNLPLEGSEGSFKMSEKAFLHTRFLIGIKTNSIDKSKLTDIVTQINMPQKFMIDIERYYSESNIVLFGFEQNKTHSTYKIYFEFWEKNKRIIANSPDIKEPMMQYIGFKWNASDNTKSVITSYFLYPFLSVDLIFQRLDNLYSTKKDNQIPLAVKTIIRSAAFKSNDSMIYLEATEDNTIRNSFDINLYKSNLKMIDIEPVIKTVRQHYEIPQKEFDAFFKQISPKQLGHLSGGFDKNGKSFLTFYFEI